MSLFYNMGILAYGRAIKIASAFNPKAKLWVTGRQDWATRLRQALNPKDNWMWVHCSSLGEFEQGRPLIEEIKAQHSNQKILLTFYSPSGYEIRKNYPLADHVCYLPLDTPRNARLFLDIVQPKLIVHVKYDLWLNLIADAARRNIRQILISAILRPDSRFLKSILRSRYRRAFASFNWIFTQDKKSELLLKDFSGMYRISTAGDTRFDRVAQLPGKFELVPGIEKWLGGRRCIVIGSAWPKDEEILLPVMARLLRDDLCWIIAPHEIHPAHIAQHIQKQPLRMLAYSRLAEDLEAQDILWIDNVGMLSRLYHYSELVYIGGGFGVGIHNTQEPAVYGNPVIFGPNYEKFQEAVDMIAHHGAKSVSTADELEAAILHWLDNHSILLQARQDNLAYMQTKTGATHAILDRLHLLGFLPINRPANS